ncbi:MAG: cation transporter, partial [Clostridia bacterium]|nr:cation transporter [Clostridia bacterium]
MQNISQRVLQIDGMTCTSCEMRIENRLKKMNGVMDAKASFSDSKVSVTYDAEAVDICEIIEAIEKLDYKVKNQPAKTRTSDKEEKVKEPGKMSINQLLGIAIIIFALYLIIKNTIGFNFIPEINQSMGYGILFVIGLITSLHCVAMCGGINFSQCVSYKAVSYTH